MTEVTALIDVGPLKDGKPDLYNHMPNRLVPLEEAKKNEWTYFYEAQLCRYGHQAPRFVSNPRLCVDCHRAKRGKPPITAGTATAMAEYKAKPYTERKGTNVPIEPDNKEKHFLGIYAREKDLKKAAKLAGLSESQIHSRLSWSKVFKEAFEALEDRLGIKTVVEPIGKYRWTKEKRERFIEIFVDTGDAATARDSIAVTPSEYFREIERNADFEAAVLAATPLAAKALEEKAIQMALAGNDKLLTKVLSAKMPEYRDRVNVDMNVTEKLDDRQLNSRLLRLLGKFQGSIVEGDFQVISEREDGSSGDAGRVGQERVSEPNQELLHSGGTLSEGSVPETVGVLPSREES